MMFNTLKRGIFAIAPLAITLAIAIWLFTFLENTFKYPVTWIIGERYYYPGMGLLFAIIVLFFLGLVVNTFIATKLTNWTEKWIKKIPFIKTIYSAVQDFMEFMQSSGSQKGSKVVKITIHGMDLLGIVTKTNFEDYPDIANSDQIAVYLPMSYQLGGYTILCKKEDLTYIDMPVDHALEFIITAGAKQKKVVKT